MASKSILLFCAQAILAQSISSQYVGAYNGFAEGVAWGPATPWNAAIPYAAEAPLAATWAAAPCAATPYVTAEWATGFGPGALAASNGGGLPIVSGSPYPVTGISMTSENMYDGSLAVFGAVPFLGAVALEGALPTIGAGAVNYGCGNGNIAMMTEDLAAGPYGYGAGIAAAELGYGYGAPLAYEAEIVGPAYGYNRGIGCGGYY